MLVDDIPPPSSCDLAVWLPGLRHLMPTLADVAALLPIRALNEALAAAVVSAVPVAPPLVAGVLAVDPFLNGARLYELLAGCGVQGVVNMPSVSPANGVLGRALNAAELGPEQEIACLARARTYGLEPIALVFEEGDVTRALATGIRRLILHPGIPKGDARLDRKLADDAVALLETLRHQGLEALLYRHPDLERWLPGDNTSPGQLVWAVSTGPRPRHPRP